jgi:hypothetical protein
MTPDAPRRRPRARPPAPEAPPAAVPRRGTAFGVVWWAALAVVLGVVVVAFATGTADDLPWGAIIGVLAVLAFAWVAMRRRAALAGDEEDDGDRDGGP